MSTRQSYLIFKRRPKRGIKICIILTLMVIFFIALQQTGISQDFPKKSITILVPMPPGGPSDITARFIAETAREILGQALIVVNKPGGGQIIAQSIVAKEKPDGYTLSVTSIPAFVTVPQMREVAFDPLKDFEYIIAHMILVGGIVCRSDKPWKSMKDVVAYSKQHPEQVTYATVGTGTTGHIAASFIETKEKVKWRMIPYDGAAQVTPAVLGGHVDLGFSDIALFIGHVKTGELRLLAIEKVGKEKFFPGVTTSTFEELGYEIPVGATFGIIAPKGTPADIIKKIHDAFKRAIEDLRYEEHCDKLGVLKTYQSGQEFFRKIRGEYEARGKVLKELGLAKKK